VSGPGATHAWRVVHRDFAESAFDGEGARRHGGRWNPVGIPAVYASESLALAVLEAFVRVQDWSILRERFRWFRVRLPTAPRDIDVPSRWREHQELTRKAGREILLGHKTLASRIPSAILPDSCSLLLSVAHPDFAGLSPEGPFELSLDKRL